ncbi:MAG: bacillithiol biosynthesis cysteine-adding enzyme BshC [Planctomycetota bacterium]|jgi:bacillithiol biosynthesis cysteine-adding enzyme BshC
MVEVERLLPDGAPSTGAFAAALRAGEGEALRFLPALPTGEAAWREALDRFAAVAPRAPAGLVDALAARQAVLGAGAAAIRNAQALGEDGTLAVVTGQQPGLLGGPLLTFHKAAGAIHLARRLDGIGGRRVVPVFWLASEDHDLAEANRLVLLDERGQARRLSLDARGEGRSLMHVDVSASASRDLLETVAALLPQTERAAAAMELVRRPEGMEFATWCAVCLLRVLGDSGLVLLEPEIALPHAGDALAGLLQEAGAIRRAVQESAKALEASGLPAPIHMSDEDVPLFLREAAGGPRLRVTIGADGHVHLRGRSTSRTPEAVAASLRQQPELGSGDVVGRVFVQDALLPVLAYVAGPTEIAYHAQVRAAHEATGRPYGWAVPRPEATWVDGKAARSAEAFGRTLPQILGDADAGPQRAPEEEDPALATALEAWHAHLDAVPESLRAFSEGRGEGPAALRRTLKRLRQEGHRAAEAVRQAFQRDRGVGADRWARLQALLRPRGRPQERSLSPVSLLARHGVEPLREGLAALDPLAPGHFLVRLS